MAAQKLGITVRSVRRLMQALARPRHCRSSATPQKRLWVISKSVQTGKNSFSKPTVRVIAVDGESVSAQVAVRVKVRAQELGTDDYPSHMTVYRLLRSHQQLSHAQQKRSLGWKGSLLCIKTREGLEIAVEWSNQVWQCDHTKVDVARCRPIRRNIGASLVNDCN